MDFGTFVLIESNVSVIWFNGMNVTDLWYAFINVQFQYAPQHLVRLLQIIVDNNCDMGVRQNASIHFKNFIAKNWSPDSDSGMPFIIGGVR